MPVTVTLSVLSTQMVQSLITVQSADQYDPTGDEVQWAFPPDTYLQTQPVTWYTGGWAAFPGPAYWAQCLIGPANGGVPLPVGRYQSRIKITGSPEVPVLYGPVIEITL
jgi:hypothetical protein